MRRLTVIAAMLAGLAAAPARAELVTVNTFSDILFWTGSGTNASALVLQFGTSATPTSVAWGYRWNGSASYADMLFALAGTIVGGPSPVAGADPRLSVNVSYSASYRDYFVNEIGLDQVGLPSPWTQVSRSIGPYDPDTGEYSAQYQLDAANGSWSGDAFDFSNFGIAGTPLVDGGWYGFVQADGSAPAFNFTQPVAAVPEPSGIVILAGGAVVAAGRLRRRFCRVVADAG